MSDYQISDETARESRRLGDRLAEQVLKEAEAFAWENGIEGGEITDKDISDAWARMLEKRTSPPRGPRARTGSVFKFIVMTLAVAAAVFLVFELTATRLPSVGTAAVVVGTIGFFYLLASAKVRVGIAAMTKAVAGALGQLLMFAGRAGSRWRQIQRGRTVGTDYPPGKSAVTYGGKRGGGMTESAVNKTAPGVRADVSYQVKSYRYLRIGIVGLLVALGTAVVYQRVQPNCSLGSVSAYFYTPVRSVFVAGLVGLGVCMLALRGMNLAEDIFLNIGGIFAILVALFPAVGGSGPCQDPDTRVSLSVQDNITALLSVGIIAIAVALTLLVRGWQGCEVTHRWWALIEGIVALALWAATLIAVTRYLSWALGHVHYIAAFALAGCIILVAVANAFRRQEKPIRGRFMWVGVLAHPIQFLYTWMAAGMVVISGTLLGLALASDITVFWVEISVAFLFAIFWTAQTIQLEVESRQTDLARQESLSEFMSG